ncbi:A-kinase anchor protein 14-like isoform X2 [Bacillus rossius redtenbacheri]|uniref:A-kinase anchor protein 14-like isoform X2 n=1 Tax=Bacillus rossius redtenbacheri TaxID=93214 RepID=UPI002FDC7C98
MADIWHHSPVVMVKWSIPTQAYPIPQAVASVFFTIEVSKIKPGIYPVQVTYAFEGHQFVHKPGETDFCEDFLQNIIDSKIKFIKQINF